MKEEYREYYAKHRIALEKMKADAIATIPCQRATTKMWYDCPCGANVVAKNLQFHFLSDKHRSVFGDL